MLRSKAMLVGVGKPLLRTFGPGGLLVDDGRSTRNANDDGADVSVSGSMGHGQHGWSTATGQGY